MSNKKFSDDEVKRIWEGGNRQEIQEIHDALLQQEGTYRIIRRSAGEALERYFRNHTPEDGYFFHPTQYEWDGKVWILEGLKK